MDENAIPLACETTPLAGGGDHSSTVRASAALSPRSAGEHYAMCLGVVACCVPSRCTLALIFINTVLYGEAFFWGLTD
jgi:hypothetical protein